VVLLLAIGGYLAYRHVRAGLSGCEADGSGPVQLNTQQAGIAATIAGVAHARRLPSGAVTIAYATAMQESKMQNLRSGDLDSVGVFQQRPSEGWGTPSELIDPVYATSKFFAALVKVPDYLHIPIDQAAQDVQHSADGAAYLNYAHEAVWLTDAFTGQAPHAVWCWYPSGITRGSSAARGNSASPEITQMRQELVRTFGRLAVRQGAAASSVTVADVAVRHQTAGWAVASWLVTHAAAYGITDVLYAGYEWSEAAGSKGWTRNPAAPSGQVELR
jgi:hypothetical protein